MRRISLPMIPLLAGLLAAAVATSSAAETAAPLFESPATGYDLEGFEPQSEPDGSAAVAPEASDPLEAYEPPGIVFDPSLVEAGCWRCIPAVPGADPAGEGFPKVSITGFFQADAIWFHQDTLNKAVVGDAQDIADFRRARLAAKGSVAENVDFMLEYDFAFPGRPSFMDVYLDVADLAPVGRLRVGQFRQPLSLDGMTSIRDVIFLERSLAFAAYVPFRQIGAMLYDTALEQRATWAVSAYRFPTDVFGDVVGDAGYGCSTRETALLYDNEKGKTVHVGAGYTYNQPATAAARLRAAPEVGFNQLDFRNTDFPVPFFVDTGLVPTDDYQVYNLELAGTRGRWFFQSEYYGAAIGPTTGSRLDFQGAYAQLAYCLTGESHAYNKAAGAYGRIIPRHNYGKCGIGAWEVAARLSYLDLTDGPVVGGEITDTTLGLNWYLNRYTKFQLNYIHVDLERPAATESDANVFAARAQLDF